MKKKKKRGTRQIEKEKEKPGKKTSLSQTK
jgi:hypothetical protein